MSVPHSRAVAFAVLLLGQLSILGLVLATESVVLGVFLESIELILIGCVVLAVRYRSVSRALRVETERAIALRERSRLTAELHDGLGHQLAVIALRASALQTAVPPEARSAAEAIRMEAEVAVERLHQALDLLHAADSTPVDELREVLARSRAAGTTITDHGFDVLTSLAPPVQTVVVAVVREALTNAIRHQPGAAVTADLQLVRRRVTVTVRNPLPVGTGSDRPSRTGTGMREMQARVEALGGELVVTADETFALRVTLPADPRPSASADGQRRRPASLLLLRDLAVGAAAALLIGTGSYLATSTGTVLEAAEFASLHPGMPAARAARVLPPRQAAIRLARVEATPATWRCGQYSDGNAPFAIASFEVCTAQGRITAVTDLRKRPWR